MKIKCKLKQKISKNLHRTWRLAGGFPSTVLLENIVSVLLAHLPSPETQLAQVVRGATIIQLLVQLAQVVRGATILQLMVQVVRGATII